MADRNLARVAERAQQKRFLMQCLIDAGRLAEVTATLGIPPERLAQWLMQADFRRRMQRLATQLERVRETQLQLGSVRAAERLAALTDAEAGDPQATASAKSSTAKPSIATASATRAACVDLIRLARGTPARPPRVAKPSVDGVDDEDRVHPGLSAALRDELVEELARGEPTATPRE